MLKATVVWLAVTGFQNIVFVSAAPIEVTTNATSQSLNETLHAKETGLPLLIGAHVNKTEHKLKLEQENRSTEWQQNSLGKWEWKGKPKNKKSLEKISNNDSAAALPAAVTRRTSLIDSASNLAELELQLAAMRTKIKASATTIDAANSTAASVTTTSATTTHAENSTLMASSTTLSPLIAQVVLENTTKNGEVAAQKVELVLKPAAEVLNSTVASTVAATHSETSSTAAPVTSTLAALVPQVVLENKTTNGAVISQRADLVLKPLVEVISSTTTAATTHLDSSSTAGSTSTLPPLVPQIILDNKTKNGKVVAESIDLVLKSLADVVSTTAAATTYPSTTASVSNLPTIVLSATAVKTLVANSSTQAPTSAAVSTLAVTVVSSFSAPVTAPSSNIRSSPETLTATAEKSVTQKIVPNYPKPVNETVYNSLSDAGAGLKVGEKLEVASVDANTNTVVLSVHSESSSVATEAPKPATAEQPKTQPTAASVPHVAEPPKPVETKPTSHLLFPLIPVENGGKKEHFSGAASQFGHSVIGAPRKESDAPKKSNHISLAASDTNLPHMAGPAPEPGRKHENGGPKVAEPRDPDRKHWSGSASDLADSKFHGPKSAGPDGLGKPKGKLSQATPQPVYGATVIGYDKVPYLWDSIMQGVLGMVNTASNYVAPVVQSDSTQGILSSLPAFDFGSLQNAKDSARMVNNQMHHAKGRHN